MGLFHHEKVIIPENPVLLNSSEPFSAALQLDGLERYGKLYCRFLSEEKRKEIQKQKYIVERGLQGEELTLKALLRTPLHMLIIKDLHFSYGTIPTQIDFIVITNKLFFVLESKNWNSNFKIDSCGEFISLDTNKRWKSPIAQNLEHVEYVRRIYQGFQPKEKIQRFQNLIVWANESSVLERTEAPVDIIASITYAKNLPNLILEKYNSCSIKPLKLVEMQKIADFFLAYCSEHAVGRKCPVCGKNLVLRKGKTAFWGCEGFQNGCRYTEQVACDVDI